VGHTGPQSINALGVGARFSCGNSGRKHQLDDVYNPVAEFISALEAYEEMRATRKVSNLLELQTVMWMMVPSISQ